MELSSEVKVLIVDDSPSVQRLIMHILSSDQGIKVCGFACNGKEALEKIRETRPDVITMDMSMPVMDGESAIRRIMETDPIPIVVITASYSAFELKNSYRALNAGALVVLPKPVGINHEQYPRISAEILHHVRSLAGIKLVKRIPAVKGIRDLLHDLDTDKDQAKHVSAIKHVAIGASTGGPPVILSILKDLPPDFRTPIYLVQHISRGFNHGFVSWLNSSTGHRIEIAEQGVRPLPGVIYTAPENTHIGLDSRGNLHLFQDPASKAHCPSVSYLFQSLAAHFGDSTLGILLTGMGKDGAAELKELKLAGGMTVAQDEKSSVVYGMPGEAVKIGGVQYSLSPGEIARLLKSLIC